jgi:hypothetical protein
MCDHCRNVQTWYGNHPASGILLPGESGRSEKLTTHLYIAQKLRMSGAKPLFPMRLYYRVRRKLTIYYGDK